MNLRIEKYSDIPATGQIPTVGTDLENDLEQIQPRACKNVMQRLY
jgi:hypothetical protein